jgi:hypothetical protein
MHRLICGDALDPETVGILMDGEKARMVFTDPPYNVPIDGHVGGSGKIRHREFEMASGEMTRSEFTAFLARAFQNLAEFSLDGSIHLICMDWRHMREMMDAGETVYAELRCCQTRVRTHSNPEGDDGREGDCREEVGGEFVVAGGDSAEVFQAAERGFDAPAFAIALHIVADRAFAVSAARNDRPGAGGLESAAQAIGVIALIGDESRQRASACEHLVGRRDIADIAGGETDDGRPPEQVRQGMEFGCLATARRADGLRLGPPFPPWAERRALM